jgi:(p)ppGpp synthase/HD superfamily hydrolase
MRKAKWQLEDLAFRYLEPRLYHRIARLVAGKRAEREGFITEVSQTLPGARLRPASKLRLWPAETYLQHISEDGQV